MHQEGCTESKGGLEGLAEGVVKEGRLGDLLSLVLLHEELNGLPTRVDNEWVAVEATEDNGVLDAELIVGQDARLPAETFIGARQVLEENRKNDRLGGGIHLIENILLLHQYSSC